MSYKVLVTDEAIDDIFSLVRYIHMELCNPDTVERLYHNLDREVRNLGDFPLKYSMGHQSIYTHERKHLPT